VAAELRRLRVPASELLAVYDELDLPVGQLRLRLEGGHGGHNGMRSLIAALGGGGFPRMRVGIDRPYDDGRPVRDPDRVADWVLSRPSAAEREALESAVERAADAVLLAVREGVELAMTRFNPR
jgi:PTH1 family peptidyl-tRNA hydrolase